MPTLTDDTFLDWVEHALHYTNLLVAVVEIYQLFPQMTSTKTLESLDISSGMNRVKYMEESNPSFPRIIYLIL